jgi:phage I-like protein
MIQLPILNRAVPADGWYHLVPVGEFPHPDTGLVQVLDEPAIKALANSFKPKLLVDQEHWSYDTAKSSEAFGWVSAVESRATGLWGKIELTDLGTPAIANGRYRFLSPVWLPTDLEKLGGNRVRPQRLDSVGLTNSPNLKGMVPLTNRDAAGKEQAAALNPTQTKGVPPMLEKLKAMLGLAATATEEEVLAKIESMQKTETDATAMKNRLGALETEHAALLTEQVERDLDEHKPVIANRDAVKKQLLANRKDTLEFLKGLKPAAAPALHNRAGKANPGTAANDTERDAEQKKADALFNRANTLVANAGGKLSFEQAWTAAKQETATK